MLKFPHCENVPTISQKDNLPLFSRKLQNWWRYIVYMSHQKKGFEKGHSDAYLKNLKRWEKDYQLQELDRLHLFEEYIEMSNLFFKGYNLNYCT